MTHNFTADSANNNIGITVKDALILLINDFSAGIKLISSNKYFGIMKFNDRFHFTDSHSCGAKSESAANGKVCVIDFDTFLESKR